MVGRVGLLCLGVLAPSLALRIDSRMESVWPLYEKKMLVRAKPVPTAHWLAPQLRLAAVNA